MDIKGYSWAGIPATDFDATIRFFTAVLGLPLVERDDDASFAMFRLPSGQLFEVFGPKDTNHVFMTAPVIGFEVADVRAAREELEGHGMYFLTDVREYGGGAASSYFEGPDRLIYELWQPGSLTDPAH